MKKAHVQYDRRFSIGDFTRNHYGIFMENCFHVHNSLWNANAEQHDEDGLRTDLVEYFAQNDPGFVRYPGGNYTSNYHWMDGIGPVDKRPVRIVSLDHPVGTPQKLETNPIGIDEFPTFLKKIHADYMLTLNLSQTGSIREAIDEVEYCSVEGGTTLSELRRQNGYDKPHEIKYYCLGNEIDGAWQMGQHTAESYAHMARETAKMIKMMNPDAKVVLCGSSNPWSGYYPEWDRIVLDMCYEYVDYLSIHYIRSYNNKFDLGASNPNGYNNRTVMGDPIGGTMIMEPKLHLRDVGYMLVELENFIVTCVSAADYIKGKHLSKRDIKLCIDEWVAFGNPTVDSAGFPWIERVDFTEEERRQLIEAGIGEPMINRHIRLTLLDALVSSGYLMVFMNHCDRIELACRWQTPVLTKNKVISTTLNHMLNLTSRYGKGKSLRPNADFPTHPSNYGDVPSVHTAAIYDEKNSMLNVFALNIDLYDDVELNLELTSFDRLKPVEMIRLHDAEPLAGNTVNHPDRIVPKVLPLEEGTESIVLPSLSWTLLRYQVK